MKLERQISRDFLKHKLETRPSLEQVMAIDGHGFGGGGGELAGGVGIASGLQGSGNVGEEDDPIDIVAVWGNFAGWVKQR